MKWSPGEQDGGERGSTHGSTRGDSMKENHLFTSSLKTSNCRRC